MHDLSTSDKIIKASVMLFSQKGYTAVTTKEIAKKAGVCEMTLFRHFESKRNLFEKAFEYEVFLPKFKTFFEENLTYKFEDDLMKICLFYQESLAKNHKMILMELKNYELVYETDVPFSKFPKELKRLLIEYLTRMKIKGYVTEEPNVLATNILAYNFGLFMMFLIDKQLTVENDIKDYLASYVKKVVSAQIASQ